MIDRAEPLARTGHRFLVVRLHFYAGLLVGPFLLIAALTGRCASLGVGRGTAIAAIRSGTSPRWIGSDRTWTQPRGPWNVSIAVMLPLTSRWTRTHGFSDGTVADVVTALPALRR